MTPLRCLLAEAGSLGARTIVGPGAALPLAAVAGGTCLGEALEALRGRSVLVSTGTQVAAAAALLELDGLARRLVLCPPDLKPDHLGAVVEDARIDAVATDRDPEAFLAHGITHVATIGLPPHPLAARPEAEIETETEWVLLTSGTTGRPKMVIHSRDGLTGAIAAAAPVTAHDKPVVWGTFYDIRRYGGLQIFFRAVLGGGSLVLSQAGEDVADHLRRLAAAKVTHLTGTPSHWRRALMSTEAALIDPDYVRLSGEIADQAVLDGLRRTYPRARISHAYASTEAGVGFEVDDGLEGFPASMLGRPGAVEMRVEDGSLRIRSNRSASRYLGAGAMPLRDPDGWIDTDDMVERRGDRLHFVGRRSGIINVGGLKVHPEEVEAVINRHARVRMSRVAGRANPITGSIVVADVVLNDAVPDRDAVKADVLDLCRRELPHHKVPVLLRFIDRLDVTAAGKLARPHG